MNLHDAVGCAVEVFCDSTKAWCQGTIVEYDAEVGYRVVYDDGNEQWEDLSDADRVHLVPKAASETSPVDRVLPDADDNNFVAHKCAMNPPPELDDDIPGRDDVDAKGEESGALPEADEDPGHCSSAAASLCTSVGLQNTVKLTPPQPIAPAQALPSDPSLIEVHKAELLPTDVRACIQDESENAPANVGLDDIPVKSPTELGEEGRDSDALTSTRQLVVNKPSVKHVVAEALSQFPPLVEWDGQTSRLSGRVRHFRSERDVTWRAFVKIYVVHPGPGSVQVRCKGAVHTTSTHECTSGGPWSDSTWTYLFPDEPVNPDVEILYAVYHAESATSNIFLGQVLIPLRTLVGGGKQGVHDDEFPLTSRQGKNVAGMYCRLEHQVLVTSMSSDASARQPKAAVEPKPTPPVAKQPAGVKRPKAKEGPKQVAPKTVKPVRPKSSSSAPSGKQKQSLQAREMVYKSARPKNKGTPPRAGNDVKSTYESQVQLVEDVTELQSSVAQAEAQAIKLRTALSRLEISHGKLRTTTDSLKRSIGRTALPADRASSDKPLQVLTTALAPKGASETSEYLGSLATVFNEASRERQKLLASMSALSQEEAAISKALDDAKDDLKRGRQQLKLGADCSDGARFLSQRFKVLMALRVDVATLEEQKAMVESETTSSGRGGDSLADLEAKVCARRKKEDQLEQEIAAHRSRHEEIVQSNAVDDMKRKVKDLQLMLMLTKRA